MNDDASRSVISALVTQSGPLGLDAFLPNPLRKFPMHRFSSKNNAASSDGLLSRKREVSSASAHDGVVRLPVAKRWEAADFTLRAQAQGGQGAMTVRQWAVQAIHRYRFTIGT